MINILLSAAMLAVFCLVYGGIRLGMRGGWDKKPLLMFAAAAVILVNILIWAVPDKQGNSLIREAQKDHAEKG